MNRAFSKLISASEGRYLNAVEQEQALAASLELPHRMLISRMLHQFEFEIVDYATHAFCDIAPGFEGPSGSLRRKKGHQDGRIILRYVAQAVREGSCEIMFEKVLSWLVGHLDASNVTGEHMEIFFHFLQQGVHRELPSHARPFVDVVFEEMLDFVRQASHSGTIARAHRRIADFAAQRVMLIMPEVKAKYGVASLAKCKRDFELLIKEVARVMRTPTPFEMKRQFAGWLVERLVSQVEYSSKVWYWSFLALREGIVECCGPNAALPINDLLETMADKADGLLHAVKLTGKASEIADSAATKLIERGESLGLLRTDEFQTAVATANRQLITELAILHACGSLDTQSEQMAQLWCNTVLPAMPSTQTSLLAANLKILLEVVDEMWQDETATVFREAVMQLVEVARRTEAAMRLADIIDKVSTETADWAIESFSQFAVDKRASYRDVRLVLSKIVSLIPSGPAGINGHEFKAYLANMLLPNLPFNVGILRQVYDRAARVLESHASPEDARLARGYLDEAMGVFDRHARLFAVAAHADRFAVSAVERGYQASPRHESLQRHGIKAGRRDGKFLVEKTIQAAIIGGPTAEVALHEYFLNEQVRLSKLPGSVIVEFLRGLLEQLREYPEIAELLLGLAQAAPAYAGAIKINEHSHMMAEQITKASLNAAPTYRDQIGEVGSEACQRDTSVMLRGLSHFLMSSPGDVSSFRAWWQLRIGQNIRSKPESFDASGPYAMQNVHEVLTVVRAVMDNDEADAVEAYIKLAFATRSSNMGDTNSGAQRRVMPHLVMAGPIQSVSFADVGAR
ncbi:MAG: hypothetical protein IT423_20565 [Pirellulaceae bacterium]|nr:hypothetical protein [Pirellulaceae bacterium]